MLVVILFGFGEKFATPAINLVAALLVSGTAMLFFLAPKPNKWVREAVQKTLSQYEFC